MTGYLPILGTTTAPNERKSTMKFTVRNRNARTMLESPYAEEIRQTAADEILLLDIFIKIQVAVDILFTLGLLLK